MAEVFFNQMAKGAISAGTRPAPQVNPTSDKSNAGSRHGHQKSEAKAAYP